MRWIDFLNRQLRWSVVPLFYVRIDVRFVSAMMLQWMCTMLKMVRMCITDHISQVSNIENCHAYSRKYAHINFDTLQHMCRCLVNHQLQAR